MSDEAKLVTLEEIGIVTERLERAYPYIQRRKEGEGVLAEAPLESLVRGVLSQNTSDRNRDTAYATLRERYPGWQAVAGAPTAELAEAIHAVNYSYTKAERLQGILRRLYEEHGAYTLDFLREWPTPRVLDYLQSFPGVGVKTASIVCLFALRRPVMAVDTHVHRVTGRLGWIGPKVSAERAHAVLQALIPPKLIFPLHLGLWEHGRLTCRPVPRCAQCAIYAFCLFAAKTAPEPPVEVAIRHTANIEKTA